MGSARKNPKGKQQPQLRSRTTRSSKGRLLTSSSPASSNALLTTQLRALGLYAADTLGDGNCLFRALSDQLHGSPSYHADLRAQICDWIEKHAERYGPFVEDDRGLDAYLKCMREDGTYGGHMELSAFAHLTHRNVKVIQPGLVYVIEWAAFSSPPASPVVASKKYDYGYGQYDREEDDERDDAESEEEDPPLNDRERRRAERDRVKATSKKPNYKGKKGKQDSQPQRPATPIDDGEADNDDKGEGTIYVAYHDWEHFSSIRNLRGPHVGLPCVKETPPPPVVGEAPRKGRAGSAIPSSKPMSTSATQPPSSTMSISTTLTSVSPPLTSTEAKKPRKVILKLKPSNSTASAPMDLDPTTIPLPDSRSTSPFPSSSSMSSLSPPTSSSSSSSAVTQPHPLRASHLPHQVSSSTSLLPLPHSMSLSSSQHSLPTFSHPSPPSSTTAASVAAANLSPPRATRSPKRSFAESESEASEGGVAVGIGIGGGKRTRRVGRTASSDAKEGVPPGEAMEVDIPRGRSAGGITGEETVDVENDEDTPSLSSHGSLSLSSSSSSSSSLSSLSSPESSPEPEPREAEYPPEPEPTPKKGRTRTQGDEKPLTRRQRKALGLPKPREVLVARRAAGKLGAVGVKAGGTGKIIIPGGRFQRPAVKGVDDEGEGDGDGEWKTNGAGRVDVRGFRELKI